MKRILQIILPVLVVALLAGGLFVGCKKKSGGDKKGSVEPPKEEVLPVEDEDTRLAKLYEFTHMPSLGGYQITGVKTTTLDLNLVLPSTYRGEPVVEIGAYCFSEHIEIESVELPNSVTSIGEGAFLYCTSIAEIEIPNSVISIGYMAFYGCIGIKSVEMGKNVTLIGPGAFGRCTGLESVVIGNAVTDIEIEAFRGCTGLKSVVIGDAVISMGSYVFRDCTGLQFVSFGENINWLDLTTGFDILPGNNLTLVVNGTNKTMIEASLTKLAESYYKSQYTIQIDASLVGVISNTYGFVAIEPIQ